MCNGARAFSKGRIEFELLASRYLVSREVIALSEAGGSDIILSSARLGPGASIKGISSRQSTLAKTKNRVKLPSNKSVSKM